MLAAGRVIKAAVDFDDFRGVRIRVRVSFRT